MGPFKEASHLLLIKIELFLLPFSVILPPAIDTDQQMEVEEERTVEEGLMAFFRFFSGVRGRRGF
jgi:hypothetical protein